MVRGIPELQAKLLKAVKTAEEAAMQRLVVNLAKATPVDTGVASHGWQIRDGKIVNDIDYLSELNAGSSKQAPAFFVEKVILAAPEVTIKGSIVTYR